MGEAVANIIIKGDDCDEAIAKLKAGLEANDAAFNAKLAAMFKSTSKSPATPEETKEQTKPQAAKPAAPQASKKEWTSLTRRPDGDGSGGGLMRSRLRK